MLEGGGAVAQAPDGGQAHRRRPVFVETRPEDLAAEVAATAAELSAELHPGTVAVLSPASLVAELALALDAAGVRATDPPARRARRAREPAAGRLANGLEFDGAVVVEPACRRRRVATGPQEALRRTHPADAAPGRAPRAGLSRRRSAPGKLSLCATDSASNERLSRRQLESGLRATEGCR